MPVTRSHSAAVQDAKPYARSSRAPPSATSQKTKSESFPPLSSASKDDSGLTDFAEEHSPPTDEKVLDDGNSLGRSTDDDNDNNEWQDSEPARLYGELVGEVWEGERKAKKAKKAQEEAKATAPQQPPLVQAPVQGSNIPLAMPATVGAWSPNSQWSLIQLLHPKVPKPDWAAISVALGRDIKVR
jgi:hypothetical protein